MEAVGRGSERNGRDCDRTPSAQRTWQAHAQRAHTSAWQDKYQNQLKGMTYPSGAGVGESRSNERVSNLEVNDGSRTPRSPSIALSK